MENKRIQAKLYSYNEQDLVGGYPRRELKSGGSKLSEIF
jgi:hypothetical protein